MPRHCGIIIDSGTNDRTVLKRIPMNLRARQLAEKRRDLQQCCELQRHQVAQLTTSIETRLALVDRLVSATSGIVNRPLLVLGGIAGLVLIGRWRLLRWVSHGAMVIATAHKVRQLLAK